MTLRYKILKGLVKAAGIKKHWSAVSAEELLAKRRKSNAKVRIPDLKDAAFTISRIEVMGFPVLRFAHKQPADRACLFLIGTGMTGAPGPMLVKTALKLAKETGLDMYVPYYPLCTEYPLTKAYEMIHALYREMLRERTADRISVLGYSSGGNLALGMVPYINDGRGDTPMPGRIIAVSPGNCVGSEEEWQRMQELDKRDIVTPARYMQIAEEIMRCGDDSVPAYMLRLQYGDYTGCPRVTLIYGGDECLYACAPAIEAALRQYGAPYSMIVGEGMFHCYPLFPVCREAREGWDTMVRLLRECEAAAE